jgi:hypothetical protein
MDFDRAWLGTVWSYRAGRTLIGKVTSMSGDFVTLSVVGLDANAPAGMELVKSERDGDSLVRVDCQHLVDFWKRMGPSAA